MSEKRVFKKPEGLSNAGIKFINPKKLDDEGFTGVVVEGTFVEAIKSPFEGDKYDYKFEKESGESIVINSCGSLAYQMKHVNPGDYCQVSYLGKEKLTSGKLKGKAVHTFEVLIA